MPGSGDPAAHFTETIVERALVYTPVNAISVLAASTQLVAASSGTKARYVSIFVPHTAVGGIHVAPGVAATTSHFLIPPGASRRLNTVQAVNAIRAGAVDVLVYLDTAVPA